MLRDIIRIDEEKCNGCGLCIPGCPEGAIQLIDGKARLVSDLSCDGLGACLGHCPEGAITIEKREAEPYNEKVAQDCGGGCPGSRIMQFVAGEKNETSAETGADSVKTSEKNSALTNWPVQLHLLNPAAPYLKGSDLLLSADCVAHAVGDFHGRFLNGRTLAVACPKLDSGLESYQEKLGAMIDESGINTLTVMMMEVPCCRGLLALACKAAGNAKRKVPVKKIVVSIKGEVLSEDWV